MRIRHLALALLLTVASSVVPSLAQAKKSTSVGRSGSAKLATVKKKVVCKGSGKARRCKRVRQLISSRGVRDSELRSAPLAKPSGWGHVFVPALNRELKVNIYNPDGSFNQASLAELDGLWMCRRTREVRAVDPRLYEVLSMVYDHFGARIDLMSGFRFQQNEGSRHFHASAMDVRVEGVSYKTLYEFAQTLDPGGMGIGEYPRMNFVHIDFRAPGERSTRWTDLSGHPDGSDPGKKPSRSWVRPPNS